eukprot:jgi/Bigna1/88752/estExt_fgenesh1_pg.C_370107
MSTPSTKQRALREKPLTNLQLLKHARSNDRVCQGPGLTIKKSLPPQKLDFQTRNLSPSTRKGDCLVEAAIAARVANIRSRVTETDKQDAKSRKRSYKHSNTEGASAGSIRMQPRSERRKASKKQRRKRVLLLSPSPTETHCAFPIHQLGDKLKAREDSVPLTFREASTPPRPSNPLTASPSLAGASSPPSLPVGLQSHVGVIISHKGSEPMKRIGRRTLIVELPKALPSYAHWLTVGIVTWPGRKSKSGRLTLMNFKSPTSVELLLCSEADENKVDEDYHHVPTVVPESVLRVRFAILRKVRRIRIGTPATKLRLRLNTDSCIARNLNRSPLQAPEFKL